MNEKTTFSELKEKERQARKELIMQAAANIFSSTTFDKVNMRDIAKEVGFSAASIYTYFPDQESLFIECSLQGVHQLVAMFDELLEKPDLELEEAAMAYVEYLMDHYEFLRMSQHCILYGKFSSQDSIDEIIATYRQLFDRFDRILEKYVDEGELRTHSHLFFVSLSGLLFTYGRYPGRTKEEVLEHMRKLTSLLCRKFRGTGRN